MGTALQGIQYIMYVWQPIVLLLAPQNIKVSSHKVLHIHLAADSHHCPMPPTPTPLLNKETSHRNAVLSPLSQS